MHHLRHTSAQVDTFYNSLDLLIDYRSRWHLWTWKRMQNRLEGGKAPLIWANIRIILNNIRSPEACTTRSLYKTKKLQVLCTYSAADTFWLMSRSSSSTITSLPSLCLSWNNITFECKHAFFLKIYNYPSSYLCLRDDYAVLEPRLLSLFPVCKVCFRRLSGVRSDYGLQFQEFSHLCLLTFGAKWHH